MEFEIWWLLVLPLVFAMGWFASRMDQKQAQAEVNNLPSSYFRGVNFLLSEQPDRAIDAFLEVANIDNETAELHFALANLFRKRGEVDRSIRLHHFLTQRNDLNDSQRQHATYELGVDYLRAGILDRAESSFESLLQGPRAADASRQLLELYELEKAWDKAIEHANRLRELGAPIPSGDIAHFHCELAALALEAKHPDDAMHQLQTALLVQPDNVRASLMIGEIAFSKDMLDEAIANWRAAEKQNPWYLPLVGPLLWKAYEAKGAIDDGLSALERYCAQYPSIDLLRVWIEALLKHRGVDVAYHTLRSEVRRMPSLLGLDHLLSMQLDASDDEERSRDLKLIRELMSRHTARLARFRCESCGFQAKQFYWQCPGCAHWDTIIPRRVEELDFYPIPEKSL